MEIEMEGNESEDKKNWEGVFMSYWRTKKIAHF